MKRARRFRSLLASLLVAYAALEISATGALWAVARINGLRYEHLAIPEDLISTSQRDHLEELISGRTRYYAYSPTLGWTLKPGGVGGIYHANSQGLRGNRTYTPAPADGTLRIAAFGDSFTHGDGVADDQTWAAQLDALDPGLEVLNFGVSGYGPDQAFLRYRESGIGFRPHVVLIGFMPENINRVVNAFRPFYGQGTKFPLSKPRFVIEDGDLKLVPNPLSRIEDYELLLADSRSMLPKLSANDYFYHVRPKSGAWDFLPTVRLFKILASAARSRLSSERIHDLAGVYNETSDAFAVATRVLSDFYRLALAEGSVPVVLLFPSQHDLERYQKGVRCRYAPLVDHLQAEGLLHVDLIAAFEAHGDFAASEEWFGGHYSPLGNQIIARYLLAWVRDTIASDPGGVRGMRQALLPRSIEKPGE